MVGCDNIYKTNMLIDRASRWAAIILVTIKIYYFDKALGQVKVHSVDQTYHFNVRFAEIPGLEWKFQCNQSPNEGKGSPV